MKITKEQLTQLIRQELKETYHRRRDRIGGWGREEYGRDGYETGYAPKGGQFEGDDLPGTQYKQYKYIFDIKKDDKKNTREITFTIGPDDRHTAEEMGEKLEVKMREKYGKDFLLTLQYAQEDGEIEI